MKQTINFYTFRDAFRAIRPDNFSAEGLSVLFDHLEQYEEDCGQELELDVIAFCCEYSEHTLEEANRNHGWEFETIDELTEHLSYETYVCGMTDTTVVFQSF
jgi:hypothetical protein